MQQNSKCIPIMSVSLVFIHEQMKFFKLARCLYRKGAPEMPCNIASS
jgi:hypothetical protein